VVLDILHHLTLPAATLTLTSIGVIYLLTRNSMLNVLGEDYILTARAKGLSERYIMRRHALKNAMLPIITRNDFRRDGVCISWCWYVGL
jgi:peptide/nickel transport system permease protein